MSPRRVARWISNRQANWRLCQISNERGGRSDEPCLIPAVLEFNHSVQISQVPSPGSPSLEVDLSVLPAMHRSRDPALCICMGEFTRSMCRRVEGPHSDSIMIYSHWGYLLALYSLNSPANGLFSTTANLRRQLGSAIFADSPGTTVQSSATEPAFVTVRFTNTINGKDVVVEKVPVGSNLLAIGDSAGVKLPRACRTGLCGSCTCELKTLSTETASNSERPGYSIIRACSTRCQAPDGMDEMVIDVHRMKAQTKKIGGTSAKQGTYADPMARFAGDWERDFKSQWASSSGDRTVGKGEKLCQYCSGAGRSGCYACNSSGKTPMDDNRVIQCLTCAGQKTVACGYCRGKGVLSRTVA